MSSLNIGSRPGTSCGHFIFHSPSYVIVLVVLLATVVAGLNFSFLRFYVSCSTSRRFSSFSSRPIMLFDVIVTLRFSTIRCLFLVVTSCDSYELRTCSVTGFWFCLTNQGFFSAQNDSWTLLFRPLSVYEGAHMVSRGSIIGGDIVLSTRRDKEYLLRALAALAV